MKNVKPNKATIDAMNETMSEEITVDELFSGIETPEEAEAFMAIQSVSCADDGACIEWKNGDACSYYYWEGKEWRDGLYVIQDNGFHVIRDLEDDGYTGVTKKHLRKPETEAERDERERLEAAYDLYLTRHVSMPAPYHYDEFLKNKRTLDGFLAIVDKTGYRKDRP